MRAKVILYGWVLSWLFLFAGAAAMDSGEWLEGSLLCSVWFMFSWLLIGHEEECGEEAERFEEWMVRLLGGGDKDNNQGLGFN